MDPQYRFALADAVLLLHLGIVLFNVFGLIAIPLGAWRGWDFVRVFWWRAFTSPSSPRWRSRPCCNGSAS